MREPSDEEREDARVEEIRDRERREQQLSSHSYDPTCGCPDCRWAVYVDDDPDAREDRAAAEEIAWNRDMGYWR